MYNRGDVVLVSFPFSDLSGRKQRPAIVVSPDSYNNNSDDVVIVAVTSQIPTTIDPDLQIEITDADTAPVRLPKRSIVLVPKVFTCDQAIIQKRFSSVSALFMNKLLVKLVSFFS